MNDDNNIVKFGQVQGGKPDENEIPHNQYVIVDKAGREFYHEGFLLFTTQHVAIMREQNGHTVPVFLMPLTEVGFVEIIDEDEVFDD